MAAALAGEWGKSYDEEVMCWVRIRLQFALIRAVDLRLLRVSRLRFHGAGFSDGAGLCRVF